MWCTCLGFEAVLITESRYSLVRHEVDNEVRGGHDDGGGPESLAGSSYFLTKEELDQLSKSPWPTTTTSTACTRTKSQENQWLKGNVVSLGRIDKNNHKVLTWYEFKNYPIIGTQFHPEKFFKYKSASPETLEFKQYLFNARLGQLFRWLVVHPAVYLQDFGAMKLKKERKPKDPFSRTDSIYVDSSMIGENEDHFSLSHVGIYDKIEIFMRRNDTQY